MFDDVASGAALGAAGGGIANMATGGKRKKQQRQADYRAYEEPRRKVEYDAYTAQREREQRCAAMEASQR